MSSLVVKVPRVREAEHKYAVRFVLGDCLGLEYETTTHEEHSVCLSGDGKSVRIESGFLTMPKDLWRQPETIPSTLVGKAPAFKANSSELPVFLGSATVAGLGSAGDSVNSQWLAVDHDGATCGIDIFGSAFFLLAQYEEMVNETRDEAGRFPAEESTPVRLGFLDTPIIDRYAQLLRETIDHFWPGRCSKPSTYTNFPTHDVDHPYSVLETPSMTRVIKRCLRWLKEGASTTTIRQGMRSWARLKAGDLDAALELDPYNTFERMLVAAESAGLQSQFYFMAVPEQSLYGGNYSISDRSIVQLLRRISDRGHGVGLHPTGESFLDRQDFLKQSDSFFAVARDLNPGRFGWGGRQHWLRWDGEQTPELWEAGGFAYDSTVGYADRPGFRAGTCYPYRLWSWKDSRALETKEVPLVLMWQSLVHSDLLGLPVADAWDEAAKLRRACQEVGGVFTHLWHNDEFIFPEYEECFGALLRA